MRFCLDPLEVLECRANLTLAGQRVAFLKVALDRLDLHVYLVHSISCLAHAHSFKLNTTDPVGS